MANGLTPEIDQTAVESINKPTSPEPSKNVSNPPPFNLNNLGVYLDGWADLIEEKGDEADKVRQLVFDSLTQRQMPEIGLYKVLGLVSLSSKDRRLYLMSMTHPGATTALNISKHGKDLFVSWRTFIRLILNKKLLLIMLAIAGAFVFCSSSWKIVETMLSGRSLFDTSYLSQIFGIVFGVFCSR